MSEIGLQIISERLATDDAFRALFDQSPLKALEGYDLSLQEYTTLQIMVDSGWKLPDPVEAGRKEPPATAA